MAISHLIFLNSRSRSRKSASLIANGPAGNIYCHGQRNVFHMVLVFYRMCTLLECK